MTGAPGPFALALALLATLAASAAADELPPPSVPELPRLAPTRKAAPPLRLIEDLRPPAGLAPKDVLRPAPLWTPTRPPHVIPSSGAWIARAARPGDGVTLPLEPYRGGAGTVLAERVYETIVEIE